MPECCWRAAWRSTNTFIMSQVAIVAEDAGLEVSWPMQLSVDNAAGEAFVNKTTPQSKLRGVFHLKDQRIKELRDEGIVTASHVESES